MFSIQGGGSGDDGPADRRPTSGAGRKRSDKLGQRLSAEQKRGLYKVARASWKDLKPGQRVTELQRLLNDKPVRLALRKWLHDFSELGTTAQPIPDSEAIIEYAFKKAKDAVARGQSIEEAVSYWIADAVFKLKPRCAFSKLKNEIAAVVRAALA
ncbi:MAG: hypothetical protein KIT09_31915 [Bryobacteraceae bacterium]|nr:hypothetical protein [Bryobacteraceae bacterium]